MRHYRYFFEWWSERSLWLRYGIALAFIAISVTQIAFSNSFHPGDCWGLAIGIILLLFAGPSDSEKNGYHFCLVASLPFSPRNIEQAYLWINRNRRLKLDSESGEFESHSSLFFGILHLAVGGKAEKKPNPYVPFWLRSDCGTLSRQQ